MLWCGGEVLAQLRQLIGQVGETGGAPRDVNLDGTYEKGGYAAIIPAVKSDGIKVGIHGH